MKKFTYVILSIVIFMGCIGQGSDYPTEDFIIKEHGHDPIAGEVIKSVDDNDKFGDTPKETELDEKFTKLGDYSGCVAETYFPDGVYTEAGEKEVDSVMDLWDKKPVLAESLMGKCLIDEETLNRYLKIYEKSPSLAYELAEKGYRPTKDFEKYMDAGLKPTIAYEVYETFGSVPDNIIKDLSVFDAETQYSIIKGFQVKTPSEISQEEADTLSFL
ncbi:MAG: hypothetical protein ACE5HW_01840, partial [Candidatus Methanofastidiosia archaeon]